MSMLVQNTSAGEKLIFYNSAGQTAGDPFSLEGEKRELNREALYDFLLYGTILPPDSIFSGVKSLFPGEALEIAGDKLLTSNPIYRRYAEIEESAHATVEDFARELDQIFKNLIARALPAHGRVALMLSGGIDSAIIATYLPKTAVCVTWAGWGEGSTDYRYARMTAQSLGMKSHLVCKPHDAQDLELYHSALSALRYPFAFTAGAPFLQMAQKLGEHFKKQSFVTFQGQNADTITGSFRPTVLSYYFAKWHWAFRLLPFKNLLTRFRRKFFLTTSPNPIELIAFFHSNGIYPGPWIRVPKTYFQKKLRQIEEQLGRRMKNFSDQILMEELMTEARRNQYVQNYLPALFGAEMKLPYYDQDVVKLFLRVPQRIRRADNFGKIVLRRLAEIRQVPREVIEKGKKGLSYGETSYFKDRHHLAVWDEMEKNQILNECVDVKLLRQALEDHPATFDVLSSLHYYLNLSLKFSVS